MIRTNLILAAALLLASALSTTACAGKQAAGLLNMVGPEGKAMCEAAVMLCGASQTTKP